MSRFGASNLSALAGRSPGRGVVSHGGLARHGDHGTASVPRPAAGVPVRLSVRLRRSRLDGQLARGLDPGASPELTLRAWQLVQPSSRRAVAQALRRAVRRAQDQPVNGLSSVVPVSREAVIRWREGLLGIADAIEHSEPVSACGVARALEMITDGNGPLYNWADAPLLGPAIWAISDGLHGQIA